MQTVIGSGTVPRNIGIEAGPNGQDQSVFLLTVPGAPAFPTLEPKKVYIVQFGALVANYTQVGLQLVMAAQCPEGDATINEQAAGGAFGGPTVQAAGGSTSVAQQLWLTGTVRVKVPCTVAMMASNLNPPAGPDSPEPQEFLFAPIYSGSAGLTCWIVSEQP
jgi:hypothetical protein